MSKSINMRFAKDELHERGGIPHNLELEFVESFTLYKISEVDLILGDTFFYADMMDVKQKLVHLVLCYDGKAMNLKLTKIPMAKEGKVNLAFMNQIKDKQLIVWLKWDKFKDWRRRQR